MPLEPGPRRGPRREPRGSSQGLGRGVLGEDRVLRTLPALGRPLSCRRFHILASTSSRNTLSHPLSHPLFHMGPDPAAIGPVPAEHGSGDGHILSPAVAFTMSLQVQKVRVQRYTPFLQRRDAAPVSRKERRKVQVQASRRVRHLRSAETASAGGEGTPVEVSVD